MLGGCTAAEDDDGYNGDLACERTEDEGGGGVASLTKLRRICSCDKLGDVPSG